MNGAESLVRTMVGGGVDVCFTNPGTSEMHFVVALDRNPNMRCVLCLFEGVATGAADGYARMADKPGSTLLHTGPGLANGLANVHNARRARSPMVNVVGDHASYHLRHDAPLTTDLEAVARPFSDWVRSAAGPHTVAADGAAAITAARTAPGRIATLILPGDAARNEATEPATTLPPPEPRKVDEARVRAAAEVLRRGEPTLLLIAGPLLRARHAALASAIANATGAELLAPLSNGRVERGAGRVALDRVPYVVEVATERLSRYRHAILLGAADPVGFFAYPGKPSRMLPPGCAVHGLATADEDVIDALERLADALGVDARGATLQPLEPPPPPSGALTPETLAQSVAALLPEDAVVCDESVSSGRGFFPLTRTARPHDWLQVTGGAIGIGLPLATGAAIGAPRRKVLSLEADGSAMYTVQALWTQAREGLDVTTVILNNRGYNILKGEMASVGALNPGPKAQAMLSIDRPDLDWVALARGMGVEAARAEDADGFHRCLAAGLASEGPYLIDAVLG